MEKSASKLHSLFLSAWYPNRDDAMSGLFVRKHAEAVSRYCKVTVLYVHADEQISKREIRYEQYNLVDEVFIYYPSGRGFLRKIIKPLQFAAAYIVGISKVFARYGRPDIVHVNVLTRTALPALYLKLFNTIPYVVTEHWTRYLPSRDSYRGLIRKMITKWVVVNASAVMPVSLDLQRAMEKHGLKSRYYQVVNNVVEDHFFEKKETENYSHQKYFHLIHISCFDDEQKNISGILRVMAELMSKRNDFQLTLAGAGKDFQKLMELALKLGIRSNRLIFTGQLTPSEVSKLLKESDILVMFSNHENAPVVISESLACGKPVVTTNVGGIPEMVNDSNGILLQAGDEKALYDAINRMIDNLDNYSSELIQENAHKQYSYDDVGSMIYTIYKKILYQTY